MPLIVPIYILKYKKKNDHIFFLHVEGSEVVKIEAR